MLYYLKEILPLLENQTYYAIQVSLFAGNPTFNAILYTGFIDSTGYQAIFVTGGCQGEEIRPGDYPNAFVNIINKIEFPKDELGLDLHATRKYNKHGNISKEGQK